MKPDFLFSRGFWTAVLATFAAVGYCLVGDGNCQEAILAAVAAWLGFAGVTAGRWMAGKPRSYQKALLEEPPK